MIERFGMFLQLGVGSATVDFLAAVASYPNPDDKIRTTSLKVWPCILFSFLSLLAIRSIHELVVA